MKEFVNKLKLSIQQKLALAFAVPVVLVFIVAVLSYNNTQRMQEDSQWVEHTHQAISGAQELLTLIVDMETGERGFLITGKDIFLEPFYKSTGLWIAEITGLKQHVSDNPEQVRRLENIDSLHQLWMEKAARPEIAKRIEVNKKQASMADVRSLIENQTGKNIIDSIRQEVAEFIVTEEALVESRARKVAESTQMTSLSIIIGGLATILFSAFVAVITSRDIVKRLNFLLAATGRVSKGDYKTVAIEGADNFDELGRLGHSFNVMTEILQKREKELNQS